jgi:hypothetical protein
MQNLLKDFELWMIISLKRDEHSRLYQPTHSGWIRPNLAANFVLKNNIILFIKLHLINFIFLIKMIL